MRSFLILALLACATAAFGLPFESRSQHHAVTIDVYPSGIDDVRYDVTITDLDTNEVLASPQLTAKLGRTVTADASVRDLRLYIQIAPSPTQLSATVSIEQGDYVIDSLSSSWAVARRIARIMAVGALHVGGDVKAPIAIHRVNPFYPEEARKARVSGIVIIEALIDRTGIVKDAIVLKDLPNGLSQAALDAVKQWRFNPATKGGQPVDVIFNLTINFQLGMSGPSLENEPVWR